MQSNLCATTTLCGRCAMFNVHLCNIKVQNETSKWWSLQTSGSQPGCRGTQGCREEVSGVPPNIEFTTFFSSFTAKGAPNCHFIQVRVPPNLFSVLKGAVNQKRLKNTVIDSWLSFGGGRQLRFDCIFLCPCNSFNPIIS